MDDRMTKFEELRRRLQAQGAPATQGEPAEQATPAAQGAPAAQATPATRPMTKFEELRQRMQAGAAPVAQAPPVAQAEPTPQAPPVAQAVPAAPAVAEPFTPEELESRALLVEVTVADDKLSATLRLHRPPEGRPLLSEQELRAVLAKRGVAKGVDDALLSRLATQPEYEKPLTVAHGRDPVHGVDGKVTYRLDFERKLLPTSRENGTVDYHNLGYILNVEEGDILCDISMPTRGEPGFDVAGRSRPARNGSPAPTPTGVNTVLSEDGLQLLAASAGAATLHGGKVQVAQTVEVPQVDGSTGNIDFKHGSVVVAGDVKEGFFIKAGKDISIKGNVEGAKLTAGGSVTLLHGMNGLGSGEINAGTDVNANFLENIDINAEGGVNADVILNCRVRCKGDISLKGPNANLVGGECITYGSVKAKDIGNDLDVVTKIVLIGAKTIAKEREELNNKVTENAEEMRKLFKTAESGVRPRALITEKRAAEKALVELQRLKDETELLQQRLDQLQATLDGLGEPGVIMAWGTMYPNTRMNFDTMKLNNAFVRTACCGYNDQGEIAFRAGQKF